MIFTGSDRAAGASDVDAPEGARDARRATRGLDEHVSVGGVDRDGTLRLPRLDRTEPVAEARLRRGVSTLGLD